MAHIYLSGDSEEIIIGNYIADFIRGKEYLNYPDQIRRGIIIHRHIDAFTDRHPVVHRSKLLFTKKYHKYAGVITDILYDHFLTKTWNLFSRKPIESVSYNFYMAMVNNFEVLPDNVKQMISSFIINDWIESYQTVNGIRKVLKTMSKTTKLPDETRFAIRELKRNYNSLEDDFLEFFPQLIEYVENEFGIELRHRITLPL
ncbi:MAG: DUF479 domain-containing protein [Bacteroidales bacterium]|nr:DUF479 domain-containing protein [Bacteroidales bacterium]